MKEIKNNTTSAVSSVGGAVYGSLRGTARSLAVSPITSQGKSRSRIPFTGVLTNKLLSLMSGSDFALLLPHLEPVSLAYGEYVYRLGERSGFVYFPETAVITHLYFLKDGSTSAATVIGNDGMIGLSAIFNSAAPSCATQTTIGGTALRLNAEVLKREFARVESLRQVILSYVSARIAHLSQKAVCNVRHNLDERLCTWLLMVQDRAREQQLRLTHEQIANYLGTRRAGVSSACHDLRKDGIIDYQRGAIKILERQLLETAACECYQAFRQIDQQSLAPQLPATVQVGAFGSSAGNSAAAPG